MGWPRRLVQSALWRLEQAGRIERDFINTKFRRSVAGSADDPVLGGFDNAAGGPQCRLEGGGGHEDAAVVGGVLDGQGNGEVFGEASIAAEFVEIEMMLGRPLPPSARRHRKLVRED